MAKSKRWSPNRRQFLLLSSAVGLGMTTSSLAMAHTARRINGELERIRPLLVENTKSLFDRVERRELTAEQFAHEVQGLFSRIDPETVFGDWLDRIPNRTTTASLYLKIGSTWKRELYLVFKPPRTSLSPHAHHNHASIQYVLKGELHARQYERVARRDAKTLLLRPVADRLFRPHEAVVATEYLNNVHWVGTEHLPAIVLVARIRGGFDDTFDVNRRRRFGITLVDPTTGQRDGDLIVAPEIRRRDARTKFSGRLLSEFESPLRGETTRIARVVKEGR